jgi:phage N-6-adenine-methyltransferase
MPKPDDGELTLFKAEETLKTVAVAEAGEKHWARAKDPEKLFKAIEAKIKAQAEYVCWRDSAARPAHRPKKNSFTGERVLPAADPGELTAHRWRKSFCFKGETGTIIDKDKIRLALDDAKARALRVVEQEKNIRGTEGTGENEWYTPDDYVNTARGVLGGIDVDPASSEQAQLTVKATQHFTLADNGLEQEWRGRIWLNPPYAQPAIGHFADKMCAEIEKGHVDAAIMLTHNYTDTAWFQKLAGVATAICFTRGRVKFVSPTGEIAAPTQGQAFFYFGEDPAAFIAAYRLLGFVMVVSHV